jgi:hypothetical protein
MRGGLPDSGNATTSSVESPVPFERIPSLDVWMTGTSVFGLTRSNDLKRLDRAIAQYNKVSNELNFAQVAAALDNWIRVKQDEANEPRNGTAWKKSARNRKLYVQSLYDFLNPRPETFLDAADEQARAVVNEAIKDAAKTIFTGTQVNFKVFGAKQQARVTVADKLAKATSPGALQRLWARAPRIGAGVASAASAGNGAYGAVKGVVNGTQTAVRTGLSVPGFDEQTRKFVASITGSNQSVEQVMNVAGFHSLANFATHCAPLINIISGGYGVTKKLYDLVEAKLTQNDLRSRAHVIRRGDPKAALEALNRLMDAQIKERAQDFAITGAAMLAKTALAFADGGVISGPAVGAAQTLAELMLLIGQIAREYREKEEANVVLGQIATRGATFSVDLFQKCPIVACYYLLIADTSTILFVLTSEYGQPGWQFKVEEMKKCCDPILKKAAEFIDQSRLEVNLLSAHRIAFEKSLTTRLTETGEDVWRKLSKLLKSGKTSAETARSSVDSAIASPASGAPASTD